VHFQGPEVTATERLRSATVIGIPRAVVGGQKLRDLKKRQLAVGVSSVKLSF
jgi:hypothetical protein